MHTIYTRIYYLLYFFKSFFTKYIDLHSMFVKIKKHKFCVGTYNYDKIIIKYNKPMQL